LDLNKRYKFDGAGAKSDGTIVEAIYTPTNTKELEESSSSLLGLLSPALPKPPGHRDTHSAQARDEDDEVAPEEDNEPEPEKVEKPMFTSLRPPPAWGAVDLSSCPEVAC
jgi:hypothetical protein